MATTHGQGTGWKRWARWGQGFVGGRLGCRGGPWFRLGRWGCSIFESSRRSRKGRRGRSGGFVLALDPLVEIWIAVTLQLLTPRWTSSTYASVYLDWLENAYLFSLLDAASAEGLAFLKPRSRHAIVVVLTASAMAELCGGTLTYFLLPLRNMAIESMIALVWC